MGHKVTEKSKENLKKGKPISKETAREYQKKSAEARKRNRELRREELRDYLCKTFFRTEDLDKLLNSLTPKEKLELLKAVLPPEKQTQEIVGNLGVQKVFITPDEFKQTDEHIDNVINEQ